MVHSERLSNFLWLVHRSLLLDIKLFLRRKDISFLSKLKICLAKYPLIIRNFLKPFRFGKDSVRLMGDRIFYNNGYASYAGYQAILTEHMYWFRNINLSEKPVLIDVGANVGYVSLAFAKSFSKSRIYAIEPSRQIYDVLNKNVKAYENVNTYCFGLGDRNKEIDINIDKDEPAFSSIKHTGRKNIIQETIQLKKLDTFCIENNIKNIDILKIDVEGYELEVLKGAKNMLNKVNYLLLEANIQDYLFSDICNTLSECGLRYNVLFVRNFDNVSDSRFETGDILFEIVNT